MQHLNVSFFRPLKTAYSGVCEMFSINNIGRTITLQDIAHLFGQAYLKAASIPNAINGFKACGVETFDSNIFSKVDFMAKTTERSDESNGYLNPSTDLKHFENHPYGGPDHFNEDRPCTSKECLYSHEIST
ncbi:hypothetical protein JTB14_019096 [Gonioctena quinquepunctata]|nr:hypothetical protein JTB14_019096 [Gonioctena quinquepunctata]